jgi:hypothetical protein
MDSKPEPDQKPEGWEEAYDVLMRPEIKRYKVSAHRDDPDEAWKDFSSETLIESLIECEVPLRQAFHTYDRFVDRARPAFPDGRLTYNDIQLLVAEILLTDPDPRAPEWLSNYLNLFGPDVDTLPAEEGYLYARRAGELRRYITNYLADVLNVAAPKGDPNTR